MLAKSPLKFLFLAGLLSLGGPVSAEPKALTPVSDNLFRFQGGTSPIFVPVGWSADGKFALLRQVDQDLEYLVLDTVSGKTLWSYRTPLPGSTKEKSGLELSWEKNLDRFETALVQADIDVAAMDFTALEPLPVKHENREIQVTALFRDKKNWRIVAVDPLRGVKSLAEWDDPNHLISILGYYPSPYEPRILVVYVRGGRQADWGQDIFFVGCDLRSGFGSP